MALNCSKNISAGTRSRQYRGVSETCIGALMTPVLAAIVCKHVPGLIVDTVTVPGNARKPAKSSREPDLVLELTSWAQQNHHLKNAKDLIRIGLSLKDALDYVEDQVDFTDIAMVGFQVIAQTMDLYTMVRCGNMYLMAHQGQVTIPDSLHDLSMVDSQYKTWHELHLTMRHGIDSILQKVKDGIRPAAGTEKQRLPTLSTPEMLSYMKNGP
ncbi:hypothetical protein BGX27_003525 [Mortierella sp. AM989]|nr:hypothetical protein BGX27_003525 [Mortierella sp. AM989]